MSRGKKIAAWLAAWLVVVTALHLWLNFDWAAFLNDWLPLEKQRLNIAYIPVT